MGEIGDVVLARIGTNGAVVLARYRAIAYRTPLHLCVSKKKWGSPSKYQVPKWHRGVKVNLFKTDRGEKL